MANCLFPLPFRTELRTAERWPDTLRCLKKFKSLQDDLVGLVHFASLVIKTVLIQSRRHHRKWNLVQRAGPRRIC